jgi:hypothetical protein
MKKKLNKSVIKLTALLVILSLMPSGLGLAVSLRPEAAVPFEEELISNDEVGFILSFDQVAALVSGVVFQNGGDRLATLQNTDGGWDWPLDDGNPSSSSPKNTIGPIGQGLADAYIYTSDPDHLAALQDAGSLLLAKTNNFSPSDGYLAATLDDLLGVTTYTDHVMNNFYGPLAASTYNRNGAGTLYSTASYVTLIRNSRASQGIPNLAAWDIGMGLVGAAAVGADTSAWIAGVKAEIDELDKSADYDVIGLAGAIYGLAYVGENHDPLAGSHEAANSLTDLGMILAGYQLGTDGFTWNSQYLGAGEESVQETAYAILALEKLDRTTYLSAVQSAADYLASVQLGTGGWEGYIGGGENNEITGEALWGVYAAYPYNQLPVAEANGPYMVAVGQTVALDHTGSTDPDGDSLSYSWMVSGPALGTVALESFTAESVAGITEVTLTVDDGWGGTATDTAMVVVYDPSGGFVTGGGWIDSPAGAVASVENIVYFNGFETDIDGWFTPTRVMSGTNGIPSATGGYHAEATAGAFTRWGGYNSIFPTGGFITSVDVYLDMNAGYVNDTRFDWSSAISGPTGNHRRDFVFTGGFYNDATGPGAGQNRFVFSASNNSSGWPKNPDRDPFAVVTTGWYTLQHYFYDSGAGVLAVDLSILDAAGNELHRWTLSDPTDVIGATVGGNRYGWLVTNGFPFLAIDNSVRKEFINITGKATFGFVSKYRRGATVPEGNTEFQFKAGDLNFSSTSYEWLVVTGSDYAKFKGEGTINGQGNYKFMIWAGDDAPDTFRIKIWYEAGGNEIVVYDNGMDQPIGGGSIVVHKR